jgi:hypothetical protein
MGNQVSYSLDIGEHHWENKASITTTTITVEDAPSAAPCNAAQKSDNQSGLQQATAAVSSGSPS